MHGKRGWCGSGVHQNTELWTQLMVSQWNSSGMSSQDSPHCCSATKSKRSSCRIWAQSQKISQDGPSSCQCNDISWGSKENERRCELSAELVSMCAERFSPGNCSFLGLGSEKKWYSTHEYKPQGEWDKVAKQMMMEFSDSGHTVFRATSPLSRGTLRSRGGGKLSMHFCVDQGTIETVFRTTVNQLSLKFVWRMQNLPCQKRSIFWHDNLTHCLCQVWWRHTHFWMMILRKKICCKGTKNEWKGYHNKIMFKTCTDAGFLTTVDRQYFMTKDTQEFSQFTESVACREYTLPKDEK